MKILIDYQYHFSNNFSDFLFFSELISELSNEENFELITPNSIEETIEKLKENQYDIFQATGNMDYYLTHMSKDKKLVVYISDMVSEILYNKAEKDINVLNKEIECKAKQIFLADKIITPYIDYKNTIKLLYSKYKDVYSKTEVIPTGLINTLIEINDKPIIDKKKHYLVYIGLREGPINVYRFRDFVKNISQYLIENDLYLVSVGKEYSKDEIKLFQELHILQRVLFVTDFAYINNVIKYSECVIYTSVYGDVDLSILNSFRLNSLVLLNGENKIYKFIGGDFGCYFEFDNIVHSIDTILSLNKEEKDELKNNQLLRLTEFNIANSSKTLKRIYKYLYESK